MFEGRGPGRDGRVDNAAQDGRPRMFGPASHTVVENVAKLPWRVSDIYGRSTV